MSDTQPRFSHAALNDAIVRVKARPGFLTMHTQACWKALAFELGWGLLATKALQERVAAMGAPVSWGHAATVMDAQPARKRLSP